MVTKVQAAGKANIQVNQQLDRQITCGQDLMSDHGDTEIRLYAL